MQVVAALRDVSRKALAGLAARLQAGAQWQYMSAWWTRGKRAAWRAAAQLAGSATTHLAVVCEQQAAARPQHIE